MTELPEPIRDLARTTIAVLLILGLMAGSVWIMRPFAPSLLWGTMIVVATWPALLRLQKLLRKRILAAGVMTLLLLLVIILPLVAAVAALVNSGDRVVAWVNSVTEQGLPPLPKGLLGVPILGPKLNAFWSEASVPGGLAATLAPYAQTAIRWILERMGGVGTMLVQFLITVVIAAILYVKGESAASGVVRFLRRLAGERGEKSARLAGQAIRSVALGVVVTALVQTAAAGIGLAVAGVPFVGILTAIILLFTIAQLGATWVLAPAVVWLYWRGHAGWGTFLLVWTLIVGSLDNFLRPILIKRGVDLPILLVLSGVIGGLVAFGIIGIFIGPVLLAVTYRLIEEWIDENERLHAGRGTRPAERAVE